MAIKVTSEGGLLYFLQKLRQLFVPRELRTGSSSEYKVLSDNNLTDGLVAKIENADSHVFSGSYSDLTAKPSINGRTLEGSQSLADLGIAAAADVPTRAASRSRRRSARTSRPGTRRRSRAQRSTPMTRRPRSTSPRRCPS